MRRVLGAIAVAVILVAAGGAHAGAAAEPATWQPRLTVPSGDIYDAVFASDRLVWAIGPGGVFRSEDAGRSWLIAKDADQFFGTIAIAAAPDGLHGWAVGGDGAINATTDGGRTWQRQNSGTQINLGSVAALDNDSAIAAGARIGFTDVVTKPEPNIIIRTDDAGASWHEIRISGDYSIDTIAALPGGQQVWMTGERCAPVTDPATSIGCNSFEYATLHSSDGGSSWQISGDAPRINHIAPADDTTAWATSYDCGTSKDCGGVVLRTTDAGATWLPVRTETGNRSLGTIRAFGPNAAVAVEQSCAVGCKSQLIETTDAGVTWSTIATRDTSYAPIIAFSDRMHGVWAGSGGASWTADGVTWQDAAFPVTVGSGAVDFADAANGWFAASKLLRTTDGGTTWTPISETAFADVDFVSPTEGWAATRACDAAACGEIDVLHSSDGGATWTQQFTTHIDDLPVLHFVDAGNGWLSSPSDGKLVHTGDGGASWHEQTLPAPNLSLAFVDAQTLWATTSSCDLSGPQPCPARVFVSADGGDTWRQTANPGPVNQCGSQGAIAAIEALHAWVALQECEATQRFTIARTTDGGRTWKSVTIDATALVGMRFFNASVGSAAGIRCVDNQCAPAIWRTEDGGATWTSQVAGPSMLGYYPGGDVQFVTPERAWMMTQLGGGIASIAQQRLSVFVGPESSAPPPVSVTFPDTGSGPGHHAPGVIVAAAMLALAGLMLFGEVTRRNTTRG